MIQKGFFLNTDITGYTQFLSESELDHANDILRSLFDTQLANIKPPLIVAGYQGDAITTYAPEGSFTQPQALLETIENIYFEFRQHLERMQLNTTCTCNACANIPNLDLKLFVHYGAYVLQAIGDHHELQGSDVIVVHRMMKNTVRDQTNLSGYALITEAAVEAADAAELCAHMLRHTESYEHLGEVKMVVHDLPAAWRAEREKRRVSIPFEGAWVAHGVVVPIPPAVAWDYMTNVEFKQRYMGLNEIRRTGAKDERTAEGTHFHCFHDVGEFLYTIIDWHPFEYFSADTTGFGLSYRNTYRLVPTDEGTRFEAVFEKPTEGDADAFQQTYEDLAEAITSGFAKMIEEEIRAGKIQAVTETAARS